MKRSAALLLVCVFAASLTACGGGTESDGVVCTTEVRTSVMVSVIDTSSVPIPSASVSYQINDETVVHVVDCPASGVCPVGSEQSGSFKLTVRKMGYVSAAAEVQVNRNICHVTTQQVTVVLRLAA